MLDLHSGGDLTITPFYVIYPKGWGAASARSATLVAHRRLTLSVGIRRGLADGSFITNAVQRGKPALIVESGGGARVWDEDLANMQTAITGLCTALEMLPGTPPTASDIRFGGNAVHLKSSVGGFWHPLVRPGEDVAEGQALGHVVDIWGDAVQTVQVRLSGRLDRLHSPPLYADLRGRPGDRVRRARGGVAGCP